MENQKLAKTNRIKWFPEIFAFTGLCCALITMIVVQFAGNRRVPILMDNLCEYRTIPLSLVLTWIGVFFAPRKSIWQWVGVAAFVVAVLVTILMTSAYLTGAVFCIISLVIELKLSPQPRYWHYVVPFICLWVGLVFAPPLYHAPVRAQVSRAKQEIRTIGDALSRYDADHNAFPVTLSQLTTPVAYLTEVPFDQFRMAGEKRKYVYSRWENVGYIIISAGPNCAIEIAPEELLKLKATDGDLNGSVNRHSYDPTNGCISGGDIIWWGI